MYDNVTGRLSSRWKKVVHPISLGILLGLLFVGYLILTQTSPNIPLPVGVSAEQNVLDSGNSSVNSTPPSIGHLLIPTLDINAPIITVGLTKTGNIDAPKTLSQVGLYRDGSMPGNPGTAIIDGHSGIPGQSSGIFSHLSRLKVGSTIVVKYSSGQQVTYKVALSKAYPADQQTVAQLFSPGVAPVLKLISCYGDYNSRLDFFTQRWIVTADKVSG